MHRLVERSITLWKAQNGPIRDQIGRHLPAFVPSLKVLEGPPKHEDFIDYTQRNCYYV